MMVRIGTIWDRTTEVIAGRFTILATIAVLLLFVPSVLQVAFDALGGASARGIVGGLIGLVVGAAALVATLALTAVASDPTVDQSQALSIGVRRLGPAIVILLLMALVVMLSAIPGTLLLYTSGFDVDRARAGLEQVNIDNLRVMAAAVYFLVMLVFWLWLAARFIPLMAVIANERRGLAAIGRSFALTRGSVLKLIGVVIIYIIVVGVCLFAATAIVGLIARLIVGGEAPGLVSLAVGIASSAVTAIFTVIQCVFAGQFYVAAREGRDPA